MMPDLVDRAQAIAEEFREMALARVVGRPRAMSAGNGKCLLCGEAIDEARIQAIPGARTCIECQNGLEGSAR